MKSYVVNLDRSPERLAYITSLFKLMGLEFERIPAVDGACIDEAQLRRLTARRKWPRVLKPGEVGCFLSHREFFRRVAEGDAPWGAVFEDDIVLSSRVRPLLQDSRWIPEGIDIIKLDTADRRCTFGRPWRVTAGGKNYRLARLLSTHWGAGSYLVSKSCAKRLYELTAEVSVPIDYLLFSHDFGLLPELNVQQVIPAPVMHLKMDSTIGQRGVDSKTAPWHDKAVRRIQRLHSGHIQPLWLRLTRAARSGKIAFK